MNDLLLYLVWTAFLTALMWLPYVTNMILVRGIMDAVGYPDNPKPLAPWAQRMRSAHYNAIENLAVMAPLVLVAHVANMADQATAQAMLIYLILRITHFIAYTFKVPGVRTLTFVASWVCTVFVATQLLF